MRTLALLSIYQLEQRFAICALAHFEDGLYYVSTRIVDLRRVIEISVRFIKAIIRERDNTIGLERHVL